MSLIRVALPNIEKIWEYASLFQKSRPMFQNTVEQEAYCRDEIAAGRMMLQTKYIPDALRVQQKFLNPEPDAEVKMKD